MFANAETTTMDGSVVGTALGLVAGCDALGADALGADALGACALGVESACVAHPLASRQAATTRDTASAARRRRPPLAAIGS